MTVNGWGVWGESQDGMEVADYSTHERGRNHSYQGCGVDRVFIGVDSDSGVGVLMSTPTPTPGPTRPALNESHCAMCSSFVYEHSYGRHLIVGQMKLQTGDSFATWLFL